MKKTWMGLVVMSLLVVSVVGSCTCGYSDGNRVGVVYKLSKKGYICKTWEGEMYLNYGRATNANLAPETWNFTVRDNDQKSLDLLNQAIDEGRRVKIFYHQVAGPTPCSTDSGYFVEKVELLPEASLP